MKCILLTACAVLGTMITLIPNAMGAEKGKPREGVYEARLEFKVQIPEGAKRVRIWTVIPQETKWQKIENLKIEAPFKHKLKEDARKNRMAYFEADHPKDKEISILTTFTVKSKERLTPLDPQKIRPINDKIRKKYAEYLQPSSHIPLDETIRKAAQEAGGDEGHALKASRKLYDWVLENIDYWVKDPGHKKSSGVGSAPYCLSSKTGNCTDFHSLYTALSRARGIPTRMIYGSLFKADLNGLDKDQSYHCWVEFFAPGIGWVPLDVAVADIFAGTFELNAANKTLVALTTADGCQGNDQAKVNYYFGNLDERRIVWSVGRDLMLNPKQDSGPVNALAKAHIEIDGKVHKDWSRKLTFKEPKQ